MWSTDISVTSKYTTYSCCRWLCWRPWPVETDIIITGVMYWPSPTNSQSHMNAMWGCTSLERYTNKCKLILASNLHRQITVSTKACRYKSRTSVTGTREGEPVAALGRPDVETDGKAFWSYPQAVVYLLVFSFLLFYAAAKDCFISTVTYSLLLIYSPRAILTKILKSHSKLWYLNSHNITYTFIHIHIKLKRPHRTYAYTYT